jgi:acetolactate synthase-1/2/3 large subunit
MERLADYVIRRFEEENIGHIFMVTGRGILYLTDAVAKNKSVNGISTYHEQGAAYAAMAYASATDGMSACLLSTGCAAANAVTSALCAYQDNLPVVFISGQNMLEETTRHTGVSIRTYGSQEADIVTIVKSVTKYAVMVESASEIKSVMDRAFYMANEGRKGPVWVDIPLDIQNARIEADKLEGFHPNRDLDEEPDVDMEFVKNCFETSKRPIVFIGGGVRSAGAIHEVKTFVEKHNIPAVCSESAVDAYGTGNELSIGAVGALGGSRAGNFAVQNADFILVLGSKLCSQTTGIFSQFAREAKIVAVDIDLYEHTKKGVALDRVIRADINKFMDKLLNVQISASWDLWANKCKHWKNIFCIKNEEFVNGTVNNGCIDLYYFADTLSQKLSDDSVVITDAGFEELIVPSTVQFHGKQRCLFPASQGAMGYAIPAVIGAYFAQKENIAVVVGDGSFMMNMQELLAISANKIPVKIFVIDNNMYAVIRKRQKDLFRTRTIGNDPSDGVASPNFRKISDAFGIKYEEVENPNELGDAIERVMGFSEPVICKVTCDREQKYLHTSFAINGSRKLVKRPIEDLSPFIEREIFYSEMMIKPLEE